MKKKRILLLIALSWAIVSVSCAKDNVPSFTAGIENVSYPYSVAVDINSDGAIDFTYEFCSAGTFVPDMRLAKIHWQRDEWFYTCGYKAKLSDAIEEIIAPPDKNEYSDIPFKIGWRV